MSIKRNKQHNTNKKLRKYAENDPIYRDFLTDTMKKDMEWCKSCERWIPPSYYDKKSGKPTYIHSCYDARALKRAHQEIKFSKHWGEMRQVKSSDNRQVKPSNRLAKPNKDGFWIRQWRRWLKGKGDIVP
jgi:hypothetical protein